MINPRTLLVASGDQRFVSEHGGEFVQVCGIAAVAAEYVLDEPVVEFLPDRVGVDVGEALQFAALQVVEGLLGGDKTRAVEGVDVASSDPHAAAVIDRAARHAKTGTGIRVRVMRFTGDLLVMRAVGRDTSAIRGAESAGWLGLWQMGPPLARSARSEGCLARCLAKPGAVRVRVGALGELWPL